MDPVPRTNIRFQRTPSQRFASRSIKIQSRTGTGSESRLAIPQKILEEISDSEENQMSSMVTQLGGIERPPPMTTFGKSAQPEVLDPKRTSISGSVTGEVDYLKWVSEIRPGVSGSVKNLSENAKNFAKSESRPELNLKVPAPEIAPNYENASDSASGESGVNPDLSSPVNSSTLEDESSGRNTSPDSGYDQSTGN